MQRQFVRDFYKNSLDPDVVELVEKMMGAEISRRWVRSNVSKLYDRAQKYIRLAPDIMAAKVMVRNCLTCWFES